MINRVVKRSHFQISF